MTCYFFTFQTFKYQFTFPGQTKENLGVPFNWGQAFSDNADNGNDDKDDYNQNSNIDVDGNNDEN